MRITLSLKNEYENNILIDSDLILIITNDWIIIKKESEIQETNWMTYDWGYMIKWEPKKTNETIWAIEFSEIKKLTNIFK